MMRYIAYLMLIVGAGHALAFWVWLETLSKGRYGLAGLYGGLILVNIVATVRFIRRLPEEIYPEEC